MTEIPRNIDAEAAVLGAALLPYSTKALIKMAVLTVDSFTEPLHKRLWKGIVNLLRAGKMPDPLLVKEELGDVSLADILKITEQACVEALVPHYVQILKDKERGRRLYLAAKNTLAALGENDDYEEIENALINSLMTKTTSGQTTTIAEEGNIDALLKGEDVQAWATFGVPEIDSAVGGLRPGEICILAARTSVGKSAGAIVSTIRSAETGWNPLYMSYEMSKKQLWYRMLSYQSRVSLRKFRDSMFTERDRHEIKRAQKELEPIFKRIRVNTEANTPGKLNQLVRLEHLSGNADFVIIDHAGRMATDGRNRNDYEKMSEIANRLKDLAINLNIPILVLWQLNRGVEKTADKKPSLADLRDSGQAEEVADIVILLSRDKGVPFDKSVVTVDIAKARDGGDLGEIQIPWSALISRPRIMDGWGEEVETEAVFWE